MEENFNQTQILEVLMDHLDNKTIWKVRFVCKKWNEEAIRSIRKRIQTKKPKSQQCLQVSLRSQESKGPCPYNAKWQLAFKDSEILDIFLSNMIVGVWSASEMFKKSDQFGLAPGFLKNAERSESEALLLKYGSNAKTLHIMTCDINPESLVRLFTDVCPNLETLNVSTSLGIIWPDEDETTFNFPENQTLNLKNVELWFYRAHLKESIIKKNNHIYKTLLKHCPKLASIKIQFFMAHSWELFFTGLSTIPEISFNLTEMTLTGNIHDFLDFVSKTPFGPKLTKVILDNRPQSPMFPDDMKDKIHRFLKSTRLTLKHLEFRQKKGHNLKEETAFEGEPSLMIEDTEVNNIFPELPLLKKFNTFFKFEYFGFLAKIPNLIELGLTNITNAEEILARPFPNNKIQKLTLSKWGYLYEWKIVFVKTFSSDVVQNINLSFPKLTELYLELIPPKVLTCVGLKLWFDDICKQISLMQNLKKLYILVFPSDYDRSEEYISWEWYSQVNLEDAFDFLKTTPNLQSLILGHARILVDCGIERNDGRAVIFPRAPLLKLIEAPKLTRLKLSGLIVDGNAENQVQATRRVSRRMLCRLIMDTIEALDEKEVAEVDEFYDRFSKSRVRLSIVDNDDLDWMSID